jgi:hypothetical protein
LLTVADVKDDLACAIFAIVQPNQCEETARSLRIVFQTGPVWPS